VRSPNHLRFHLSRFWSRRAALTPRRHAGLDRDAFAGNVTIMYEEGPVVKASDLPADVNLLALFRTEIASNHPEETEGEMLGTPAITSREVGGGRVVLNSPHPELQPIIPEIYAGEILWALNAYREIGGGGGGGGRYRTVDQSAERAMH
jgi:hypothetical protein